MPTLTPDTPLPGYDEALRRLLAAVTTLDTEHVALPDASGRVLRGALRADRDLPPFHRSAMDGYAVRASSYRPETPYEVAGESAAGRALMAYGGCGAADPQTQVIRIATGAPVPEPFDAVVPVEHGESVEGRRVRFSLPTLDAGHAIHPRGADARAGDELVAAGTPLRAEHLGLAAAVGASELSVSRRPRVVILSTGDEVRPFETATAALAPEQIRDSNGPMLAALLRTLGVEPIRHDHVSDDADALRTVAGRALRDADLIVTTGGVSVGARDLFPELWPALGCATLLHGVALQPGRPLLAAWHAGSRTLVAGLPGNPVSALVTALLFVAPVLGVMLGQPAALPWRRVWLSEPVSPNLKREAFRFARLVGDTAEQVAVLPWRGSGDLAHTARADGLVRLPRQAGPLEPGAPLRFLPLPGRW